MESSLLCFDGIVVCCLEATITAAAAPVTSPLFSKVELLPDTTPRASVVAACDVMTVQDVDDDEDDDDDGGHVAGDDAALVDEKSRSQPR